MLDEHDREHLRVLLGRRICLLRKRSCLTQEQLAFRIGISRSFLSRIEHGSRVLNFDELNDISDVFTLSTSELLVGVEIAGYQVMKVRGGQRSYSARGLSLLF